MLSATTLAIFVVPVLFVLISKVAYNDAKLAYLKAHHEDLLKREQVVAHTKIDAALEFDIEEDEKDIKEEEEHKKGSGDK